MTRRAARLLDRRAAGATPRSPGRGRFTPSPIACCATTPPRSGSTRRSRCSIARTPPICSISCATSAGWRAPTGAFRARGPASRSIRAWSTRRSRCAPASRRAFPWCLEWEAPLRGLFAGLRRRQGGAGRARLRRSAALLVPPHGRRVAGARGSARCSITCWSTSTRTPTRCRRRSCGRLKPDGRGVTVVGDDAQAIYSFRAARVGNILAFPAQSTTRRPTVVTLEQNYRSTEPILDAANAVIALAHRALRKEPLLACGAAASGRSWRPSPTSWRRSTTWSRRILERREAGVPLRQQAVLFRAAHHSDALEVELGRRNIPFVKFGGLRFLEAAHVKDALSCLRWAENPRDSAGGVPGRAAPARHGPAPRRRAAAPRGCVARRFALAAALATFEPPAAAARRLARLRRAVRAPLRRAPARRRRGRRRWASCAAGTSRTSSGSTTTRACGSAISSSSSSWPRLRRRASASSPT